MVAFSLGLSVTYPRRVELLKSATVSQPARGSALDIPLLELSAAGAMETLGTSQHVSSMWVDMFASGLVEYSAELRWKRAGLGSGRETKRSFSNIMGRFCARWYLTRHEGVLGLEPIEGEKEILSGLKVERRPDRKGNKVDLPDWLGWTSNGLVLAEAKGSHDGGNWPSKRGPGASDRPGCVKGALKQLAHADLRLDGSTVQSKGWAVASRWATEEHPGRSPIVYAVDPDDAGIEIPRDRLAQIIAQLEVKQTARLLLGMRHLEAEIPILSPEWTYPEFVKGCLFEGAEPRTTELAGGRELEGFQAAFGLFGVLPIRGKGDLAKLRAISKAGLPVSLLGVSEKRLDSKWRPTHEGLQIDREAATIKNQGVTFIQTMEGLPIF